MTHKCRGMLYCSIYSRENHGRSMILSFPASELAIKSTWNQPQQLPEFLGYAPGHVGRSSCPAGPLEEALRGVLAIAFLDPLLWLHGDRVWILDVRSRIWGHGHVVPGKSGRFWPLPSPFWNLASVRLQKLLPHRDIVALPQDAAAPSLWKKSCCRVMLHYDTRATSQHKKEQVGYSPFLLAILLINIGFRGTLVLGKAG